MYRLVGNDVDAADCFQEVFVDAWKFQQKEPVKNWFHLLKRFATARSLDRLRQRYRERARHSALPEGGLPDASANDPGLRAETDELHQQLREAIGQLDARQADAVCLAYLEGLSYREIAESMNISENHVGVLLNRARASLKKHLANMETGSTSANVNRDSQP